jgi:hypothetical protein
MRTRCTVLSFFLLLITASLAFAAPAFAKAAPEDTIAFVTIRNLPAFQQHLKADPLYAIWQEPSVQKFLEKPIENLKQKLTETEGKAGVKFDEIWSLFHGQVALVVTDEPENPNEPAVVLMVDVGSDGERAMSLMALLQAASNRSADAPKDTAVEETYEGSKLIHIHSADDQNAEGHTTYGLAGEVFLLSNSDPAVKRTIRFLKAPPEKSLATTAPYQAVLEKLSPDADLVGYGNISQLLSAAKKHQPEKWSDDQRQQSLQVLDALGLNGLDGVGLSMTIGAEFDTVRFFAQTAGERKGIVKILMPPPGELHSGAEAPADAATFTTVRFDPAGIFDEIQKILSTAQPQTMAMFNAAMDSMSKKIGEPFDLRKDILSIFGPRLAVYSRYEPPAQPALNSAEGLNASQQVIMVDIASKAAFRGMWDKLSKVAPELAAQFQMREYLGQQMYVQASPGSPQPPPEGQKTVAFVATDREFIYSPDVEALQAHLRRMNAGGPALCDQAIFQESLKTVPSDGRVMFSFQDRSRQVEFLLKAIKDGSFAPIAALLQPDPKAADFLGQFDLNLLPDAADITKHLSPSVFCATVQPDGLTLIACSRTTPQKATPEK